MNTILSKFLFYFPVTTLKGEHVFLYLKKYRQFQFGKPADIEAYQLKHLKKLLRYAAQKSPYYQMLFTKHNIQPDSINSLADLQKIPCLSKADLNANTEQIQTGLPFFRKTAKTTGGSTGQAVTIWKNVTALARERAATWRAYEWADVSIGDAQARFWGVPITAKNRFKYQLIDFVSNRKRLSAFTINHDQFNHYHQELLKLKPKYLYGYVSVIETFIRHLKENDLKLPGSVRSIITTSEVLTDSSRHFIEGYTGLKIYNEYGCGEVGSIAHECKKGNMHIMSDNLIVEILDENDQPSETGEIVVTDLHNYAMPLIRYKLADYATRRQGNCDCGCNLPIIEKIHGRAYDLVCKPDGSKAHPEIVMYIFEELKEKHDDIKQFQVVQTAIDSFTINLVMQNQVSLQTAIESELQQRMNDKLQHEFKYTFNYVSHIKREKSGKIRLIKSMLDQ